MVTPTVLLLLLLINLFYIQHIDLLFIHHDKALRILLNNCYLFVVGDKQPKEYEYIHQKDDILLVDQRV
jgi:hypothetical protein